MAVQTRKTRRIAPRLAALAGFLLLPSAFDFAAAGLFSGMAGSWYGEGLIKLASGASERIRCRATYMVGSDGNNLKQDMRCASDSYSLTVTSDVTYKADAGVITGTWFETGYGTGGFITGQASTGQIKAWVKGRDFNAEVAIISVGTEQTVTIRPQNLDVREVSVKLLRRAIAPS
jgi:hypothetical protein